MAEELKSCRNCGGKCDPTGWMRGDGRQGPECEGCGITTPDVESWNRLMGDQLPSQGGEAVEVVAHMYQHEETGLVGFVDQQQVDWGFEKNNPRLHLCGELMTVTQHQRILAAAARPAAQVADPLKRIAWKRRDGVMGCKRFMAQKVYDAQSPQMKGNYEPFYCAHCKADQAEDDLTMVKVSRELLGRVVKADASKGANALQLVDGWSAMQEIRAILEVKT